MSNREHSFVKTINSFFPAFFALVLVIIIIPVFTYYSFAKDLGSKTAIMNRKDTGVILLDRKGTPFFNFYEAKASEEVSLSFISPDLQNAVVAIEDKDFYIHEGYSIPSIIRSAISNIKQQDLAYGGSTITQQLVKNSLLHSRKNFLRKYQELILAIEIERRFTKQEILEMYLNSVYFGEGAFGAEQAALTYFNKSASELSLTESALLAGLLPAPSELSPISGNRVRAIERQKLVLQRMYEEGYISSSVRDEALQEELSLNPKPSNVNNIAPHFAVMVLKQLIEKYGEEYVTRSGMKVTTTLDPEGQQVAQQVVRERIIQMEVQNVHNGAAVVIQPETGEILVMVGSIDWNADGFGKYNAALTLRQPGSSFKPLVYAIAINQQLITPASVLKDQPTEFAPGYRPQNYDRRFRGNVTVRRALSNSLNIPAVEVIMMVGVTDVLEKAREFGISSLGTPDNYGPSLALGAGEVSLLELTNVYATFADKGQYKEPTSILKIEDKYNNVLYQHEVEKKQVINPETAFLISSILSDEYARAETFGNALNTTVDAAVKTGTTDEYRDSWTLGYTPNIAVGIWVGNNDNKPMDTVAGSLGAGPIWEEIIEYYAKAHVEFNQPDGIVAVRICDNGRLVPPGSPSGLGYQEYFIEGTVPMAYCNPNPSPTPTNTP